MTGTSEGRVRFRIRRSGTRTVLAAALAFALIAGTASAASALWVTSGSTGSSATLGKLSGSVDGTAAMTTTFSSTNTSTTYPLTLTNQGNIPAAYSTSVTVTQGLTLAQNLAVTAWQVPAASACTPAAAVGPNAVSGTWAALPAITGNLARREAAVWCLRTTPTPSAPASATTNPVVSITTAAGSWRVTNAALIFYLNTSAASSTAPAAARATCTGQSDNNNVVIAWDASNRSLDTFYDLEINGVRVGDPTQGYTAQATLSAQRVSAATAPDGPARVDVVVLDSSGNPTSTVQASTNVTFATVDSSRTVRCGP